MTVCVAALAEQDKSLILVADKLIGYDFVESEPDIKKIIPLSDNWWLMFAGNDISPVFPIVDAARKKILGGTNIDDVLRNVFDAFTAERNARSANRFIVPYGVTASDFQQNGLTVFGESLFKEIAYRCADYRLGLMLIIAGFDSDGRGHIAIIDDDGPTRCDIPGFATIGSGYTGAQFMLTYRGFSPNMPLREAVYYAVEAKYFGERATGVGTVTGLLVYRLGQPQITLSDDEIDKQIINRICSRLEPRSLNTANNASLLNSIQLGANCPTLMFDKATKKLIAEPENQV